MSPTIKFLETSSIKDYSTYIFITIRGTEMADHSKSVSDNGESVSV